MSQMKKGKTLKDFVFDQYGGQLKVVSTIGVFLLVTIFAFGSSFSNESHSVGFWFTVLVALGSLLCSFISIQGQWIDSFPKYLDVTFVKDGKICDEFGTNGRPLALLDEGDARALAQQFGQSRNGDKRLKLDAYYDLDERKVEKENRWIRYHITLFLRPDA
ncbi:hypothetical protein LWC08_02165 [Desulfobaculum bizertense]|uniref:hypothetical protein n=1 Tax=Desulfobaculum bizertense TaxID=376490 RepID=UPI001F2DDF0B|nr:hypothetical protein [Desulfobaculum bizertense]UIJ38392.1 hypothetical protein LWC08_02165 [Desulfobaculum bizertense]